MIKLHDGQITDLLSNPLRYNPETIAIGYAVQQEKRRIMALADMTRLQSAMDTLDEWALDYLAVELRTPAYRDSYPIETKRKLVAGTLPFYAHLGTPAAVDWVINAIFTGGHIREWFEYGGQPHHFRVTINVTGKIVDAVETTEMERLISSTKRLTSWLDEIEYIMEAKDPAVFRLGAALGAVVSFPIPQQPDVFNFENTVRTGGGVGAITTLPIPQEQDTFHFENAIRTGGGVGFTAKIPIPAQADTFNFRGGIQTGGKAGANISLPVPAQADIFNFKGGVRTGGKAGITARMPIPAEPDRFTFKGKVGTGGGVGLAARVPVPQQPDKFSFENTAHTGGGAGLAATVPVPQGPEKLEARSEARAGGQGAIITTTPVAEIKEE